MKQIPKREGAVLNGYGLSVLSLALLLFLLPFASTIVISLGETVGNERTSSLHDYNQLNETAFDGIPISGSWISSGDSLNSVCDEISNNSLPSRPFSECEAYDTLRGEAGRDVFNNSIGYYSDDIGANYVLTRGCADNTNSSISCGNNEFKMRFHDVNFDYRNDIIRELEFRMLGSNIPNFAVECSDPQNSLRSANISVDYRIDFEIWETQRNSPIAPEYWIKNQTIEGVRGLNFEFNNLIDLPVTGATLCLSQFLINHEFTFADSQIWNNEVLAQLDKELFNVFGQPRNQTVAFVVSWDDVRDSDRNIPITRSNAILPYSDVNAATQLSSIKFVSYEAEYWNAATNTLTIILGVVFALTAFASTPYFNPTKSRIIDRLRDA